MYYCGDCGKRGGYYSLTYGGYMCRYCHVFTKRRSDFEHDKPVQEPGTRHDPNPDGPKKA